MADCLFCRIAEGRIPAQVVGETPDLLAFRDVAPKAPVHVLVIPRRHLGSLNDVDEAAAPLLGSMFAFARRLAVQEGVAESGYRAVFNTGADGGQTVPHLHLHLLGGRPLGWPPG
jgi:histidine triad (HIT) family protein